ncbi:MAG: hypothetical protein JWR19_1614 [Pedosphaera sp.]|nr:hypothetical protein [Pedosphaera sp.]
MNRKAQRRPATNARRNQQRTRDSGVPNAGKGQREDVRGSGVYPISGPWPRGKAPIRTEAAWGHTATRGRTAPRPSSGKRTAPPEQEIPRSQWVKFFDTFSKNHNNWPTTVEVTGRSRRSQTEARRLPLLGITIDLKNRLDKDTTSIILYLQPNVHLSHTVPRTKRVILREDRQELEIASAGGEKAIIRFKPPSRK